MRNHSSENVKRNPYLLNRVKNLTTVFATSIAIWLGGCWWWGSWQNESDPTQVTNWEISTTPQWVRVNQNKIWDKIEISFFVQNPTQKILYSINWDGSSLNAESLNYTNGELIILELWDAISYRVMDSDWSVWQTYSILNYWNLPPLDNNMIIDDWSLASRIQQEEANIIKYQNQLAELAAKKQTKQGSLEIILSTIEQIKLDISSNNARVSNINSFLSNINNLLNSTSSLDENFDAQLKNIVNAYYSGKTSKTAAKSLSATTTSVDTAKINQRINILNSDITKLNSDIAGLESSIAVAQWNYSKKYAEYLNWKSEADKDKALYEAAKAEYERYKVIYNDNKLNFETIKSSILWIGYDSYLWTDIQSLLLNNLSNLAFVKYQVSWYANEAVNAYNLKKWSYILNTSANDRVSNPHQSSSKVSFLWWDYQMFVDFNAQNNWKNYKANVHVAYHTSTGGSEKNTAYLQAVNATDITDMQKMLYAWIRSVIINNNVDNMANYKSVMDWAYSKATDVWFEALFNQIFYDIEKQMYEESLAEMNAITSQINSDKQTLLSKRSLLETKKTELADCQNKILSAQSELNGNTAYLNSKNNELIVLQAQQLSINNELVAVTQEFTSVNTLYFASLNFVDTNKNSLAQIKPNDPKLPWHTSVVNWKYAYVNWGQYWTDIYKANPFTIYVSYWNNYPSTIWAEYKSNDQLIITKEISVNNLDDLKTSKSKLEQMMRITQDIKKYWWLPENWTIRKITVADLNNYKNLIESLTQCDTTILTKTLTKETLKACGSWNTIIIKWKEWLYQEALRLYYSASFKYLLDNDAGFRQKYYETKNKLIQDKLQEFRAQEGRSPTVSENSRIAEQIAKWIFNWVTDWWVDYAMSYKDMADDIYSAGKSLLSIDGTDIRNFMAGSFEAISNPDATIDKIRNAAVNDFNRFKTDVTKTYDIIKNYSLTEYDGAYWPTYAWAFIGGIAYDPLSKISRIWKLWEFSWQVRLKSDYLINKLRNLSEADFRYLRTMETSTRLKEWRMAHTIFWDWAEVNWVKIFKWWLHDANEFEKAMKAGLVEAQDLSWNRITDLSSFWTNITIKIKVKKFWSTTFRDIDLFPKSWSKDDIINAWNQIQSQWRDWNMTMVSNFKWIEVIWWKFESAKWVNDVLNTWYPFNK
ncbi:MAG: hypothetical protein ACD_2C00011G0002 [uncultured bacterium (gcode 4)]|uniref:Uncharacterized protein n=1 Tax=uncultured bacterium (gcode 4) TaxID=1234023 RepID=K2FGN0_9BACT|nr:MAG: hypothetical protein ACD_2C00011G0002 [uncultured bacterium (gcode 4)]